MRLSAHHLGHHGGLHAPVPQPPAVATALALSLGVAQHQRAHRVWQCRGRRFADDGLHHGHRRVL
eukprot:364169-Chlamydomonas_euryale.AAC.8